jgi:hypothetical protein
VTDGGLEDAVSAARAREEEAKRLASERRTREGRAQRELEQRRQKVRDAGRSFARRAKEAGIPLESVQFHVGDRKAGLFGNKTKPNHETRKAWIARESSVYDAGGGSMENWRSAPAFYVLEDGTVMVGELHSDAYLSEPAEAQRVIDALGSYLASRTR